MTKKIRKVYLGSAAIILLILCVTIAVGCSPIKSIINTFNSLNENYTLEITENNMGGIKNFTRMHDGNRVYLNYDDEVQMYFDKNGGITDVYTSTSNGKWSKETIDSSHISYDMTGNYAFNAFKLAKEDIGKYFYKEGDVYKLYNSYFAEVFGGEGKGVECSIERLNGKTTVRAMFKEGREDTVAIINVNKTKVKIPQII